MADTYIPPPTWTLTNPSSPNFYKIITNETGTNLVGTDGYYIYKSSNMGATFSNGVSIGTRNNFINAIAANSSLKFVVAAAPGIQSNSYLPDYIYMSNNYGATFAPLRNSPKAVWQTVTSDATGKYLVAGQSDPSFLKLYYSTNSGVTWKQCGGTGNSYWLNAVSSSDGNKVYVIGINSHTYTNEFYVSTNYGESFTNQGEIKPNLNINRIVCNTTGQHIFITSNIGVIKSSDYGINWTLTTLSINNSEIYYAISVSSTGKYVFTINNSTDELYFSSDYGDTWTVQNIPTNDSIQPCYAAKFSNNESIMYASINSIGLFSAINSYAPPPPIPPGPTGPTGPAPGPTGPAPGPTGTTPGPTPTGQTGQSTIPCFKEGTLILTDRGYIPVQELHKGDLVKTFKNGFLPIDMIGVREIYHKCLDERVKDQLYRLSKDKYKDLTEDLILTGCHAILVDCYRTKAQREKTIEINGDTYVTDNKYRLPACADEKAEIYETPGLYNIYHLALENDDYYMNYGIYANGLLVESSSKRYMKELSGMALIE